MSKHAALFPGSTHIALEDLARVSDRRVCEFAKDRWFVIVTADSDFYELVTTCGPPRNVIWLRSWDYPTAVAEQFLRSSAGLLILTP